MYSLVLKLLHKLSADVTYEIFHFILRIPVVGTLLTDLSFVFAELERRVETKKRMRRKKEVKESKYVMFHCIYNSWNEFFIFDIGRSFLIIVYPNGSHIIGEVNIDSIEDGLELGKLFTRFCRESYVIITNRFDDVINYVKNVLVR